VSVLRSPRCVGSRLFRWTVTRAATRGLVGFIAAASVDANGARGGGSRSGGMHGGHGERYTQRDVESFWGDLLARNIALLRRSWSSLELVVGIPWLARERQRQRRLYERQRRGRACLASGGAADRPTLSRARQCFELAHAAYSAYDEDLSALDRFLLETSVRAEEVHYLQPTSMFIELAPVPGHLVVTAHEIKAVVLVIRGTEVWPPLPSIAPPPPDSRLCCSLRKEAEILLGEVNMKLDDGGAGAGKWNDGNSIYRCETNRVSRGSRWTSWRIWRQAPRRFWADMHTKGWHWQQSSCD
jgi:hypothetical protein